MDDAFRQLAQLYDALFPVRNGIIQMLDQLESSVRARLALAFGALALNLTAFAQPISIPTRLIGNPGNRDNPDVPGLGGVPYEYLIGTTETTNTQYAACLNAVATSDPHGMYDPRMGDDPFGGITRSGVSGAYVYQVRPGFADKPVNYISTGRAVRFVNWLHNGQPIGPQDQFSTEEGTYRFATPTTLALGDVVGNSDAAGRHVGWLWAIPTRDEWYKAAYGNAGNSYTHYATNSNTTPSGGPPPGPPNSENTYDAFLFSTTPCGAYVTSPSYWGTYDQGGNIAERCEGSASNPTGTRLLGGSFEDGVETSSSYNDGNLSPDLTTAHEWIGLRVVQRVITETTGACCLPQGCSDGLTAEQCANLGGSYRGNGTSCGSQGCSTLIGACCLFDGTCVVCTSSECASLNGRYRGNGVTCSGGCHPVGSVVFVSASAAPGGDGSSWASAYRDLQDALDLTLQYPDAITQIWVSQGVYRPDRGSGDRTAFFKIASAISVYGGFAGTETSPDQRSIGDHLTILSGDLSGNDTPAGANMGENSIRVLRVEPEGQSSVLDGLTVSGGAGQSGTFGTAISTSQSVLRNCVFAGNRALNGGSVVNCTGVTMSDCVFTNNFSQALFLQGTNPANIADCVFDHNSAVIDCQMMARVTITGCSFFSNSDTCLSSTSDSDVIVQGCLFEGTANVPAISFFDGDSALFLSDTTFRHNTGPGTVEIRGSEAHLSNCLFEDNSGPVIACANRLLPLTFASCTFRRNGAPTSQGGAVKINCNRPVFSDCVFESNSALEGGAIYLAGTSESIVLDNTTTFHNNTAVRGGAIFSYGTVLGSVATTGSDTVYSSGTLSPGVGTSVGTMVLGGLTNIPDVATPAFSGNIDIDIAGTAPGTEYDTISAPGGQVNIQGGALRIRLAPGFTPQEGQTFDLISGASVAGAFWIVSTPSLPSGLYFAPTSTPSGLSCTVSRTDTLMEFGPDVTSTLPTRPTDVRLADLNADGFPELLAVVPGTDVNLSPGALLVFPNRGIVDGAWAGYGTPIQHSIPADPRQMAVGRFGNDAADDVAIVCSYSGALAVCQGAGSMADVATPVVYDQKPPNFDSEFDFDGGAGLSVTTVAGNIASTPGTALNAISVIPGYALSLDAGPGLAGNDGGLRVDVTARTTNRRNLRLTLAWKRLAGGFTNADLLLDVGQGFQPVVQGLAIPTSYGLLSVNAGSAADNQSRATMRLIFHGATSTLGSIAIDNVVVLSAQLSGGGSPSPRGYFALNFPANRTPSTLATIHNNTSEDLAVGGSGQRVFVFRNDGFGRFGLIQTLRAQTSPYDVAGLVSDDLDADGRPDLAWTDPATSANGSGYLMTSLRGTSSFSDPVVHFFPGSCQQLLVGRLIPDNLPRLMCINTIQGTATVLTPSSGSPTGFRNMLVMAMGASPQSLIASDLEGDGDGDLAYITNDAGIPSLRLLRNDTPFDGPLTLGAATDVGVSGAPLLVRSGDVNGDGNPDLVVLTQTAGFLPAYTLSIKPNLNTSPCPADFNQDGGIDGADIDAFFAAWSAGDGAADVNSDGGIDGADVSTFFAAWEAGGC